ncbi:MAG: S8 family serine peptidase [Alphaproteobacteria bacterium]|nr:S8 family serine peptidase [Alphaproteobacteria bacterium]MBU2141554.1 S8 family serine peptidase [Alphaproteobacteria bacterium]MBU2195723.1 S8 family serine peptidase [Alphaproteobacteria bacterium]
MLPNLTRKTTQIAIGAAMASLLVLSACDQQGTRLERARELADATLDQISGRAVVEPDADKTLMTASVMDRAIAGTLVNDMAVQMAGEKSMFAIGSIIAKPKDIQPASVDEEALMMMDEEDVFEDIDSEEAFIEEAPAAAPPAAPAPAPSVSAELAQPARLMPKVKLDPDAPEESRQQIAEATQNLKRAAAAEPAPAPRTRSLSPRSLQAAPAPKALAAKKLARRSMITGDAIRKQQDANSVMLDTLSKYGMDGQVALSREGQMVIQIGADGADPTRFTPEQVAMVQQSFLAVDTGAGCPETTDLVTVQSNAALATECIVQDLRASGQFEYVEKDFIFENQFVRRPKPTDPGTTPGGSRPSTGGEPASPPVTITSEITPNDPLWSLQWNFQSNGAGEGKSAGGAGFQDFWTRQANEGSSEVVVAVVDTGLQMAHPDIKNSPNVAPGWDMVSDPRMGNDGDGRDNDPNDPGDMCDPTAPLAADTFHGTHVAGTIGAAASNNGTGVAGGAWNVKIVPVRALGKCGGRLSDINDAIRWAGGLIPGEDAEGNEVWNENPADIINLSIGLFEFCPASLQDAIDSVTDRGVIVVAAAGNARVSTQYYAPGGCQNVISVAAGDARGQIAPYSNFGPNVTVIAPGGDLTRDDNGDGRPDGVLSTKASTNCYDPVTGEGVDNCYYAYEQGTSMAAPHVAAALALLKARQPSATPDELKATLIAALDPREPLQCAGSCALYPGTTPIPGSPDMCARPCGGLLNLANVPTLSTTSGGAN